MDSETFRKAIEKATFDSSITELVIESDGERGWIDTVGAANDRLARVEFPFDVEGEWGITDPEKLIKSLKNIKDEFTILQKDEMFFIKGGSKKYKFPVVDDVAGIRNRNTLLPRREDNQIFFNGKPAATLPVVFKIADVGTFKKTVASEKIYKENTTIIFKKSMNLYGEDITDFAVGDVVNGEFKISFDGKVSSIYNYLNEVVKVLGSDDVTVCLGENMLYIDDVDGDVVSTFVIMPLTDT